MEEIDNPDLTLRAVGRQWYWIYEYANLDGKIYDSYIISREEIVLRLLEVDNCLSLPIGVEIRVVISSGDVIHSWTIPSLGIKADGIPGRLNQVLLRSIRPGIFIGQCSEICGANHRFIPVVVEFIEIEDFVRNFS